MKKLTKNILVAFLIFLAIAAVFSLYDISAQESTEIDVTTLINQIEVRNQNEQEKGKK